MIDKTRKLRATAIIQARMGSSRLPGKTLVDIAGKPLLERILDRTKACLRIDDVVVATTDRAEDDPIVALAERSGAAVYRGSPDDVLDRYYQAARQAEADAIVRITADDPFKDPEVVGLILEDLLDHPEADYVSNTLEPTYPEGLDVEAFTFRALERAWKEAELPSEREHVTPYIWTHPDRFNVRQAKNASDLSHLRWTLDYEEDLVFARAIYARFDGEDRYRMEDVLSILAKEPELSKINQRFERNAGYLSSVKAEGEKNGTDRR